jgi:ADP-heptose:LPS heptosyltransferase
MRFQALGDTIIILPYLQSLKRQHPQLKIQLLTRKEVSQVCEGIDLFDKVIKIGGGRNASIQFILSLFKLPYLWLQGYDVVLDLQKHRISTIVRKLLHPPAWAEFDKYSPKSAGERTKETIESLGLWKIDLDTHFKITIDPGPLLLSHGWNRSDMLVVFCLKMVD